MTEPELSPLYVALIGLAVASLSALAPLVSLLMTSKVRSREKKEDWARQDAVAKQAAEAAELLLAAQEKTAKQAAEAAALLLAAQTKTSTQTTVTAKLLLAAQEKTSQQNVETQGKLNQIHTLVNSNLTKEMQERLVALQGQILLMKEVIRLNRMNKLEPTPDTESALKNLEGVSGNLETSLIERLRATTQANSEAG